MQAGPDAPSTSPAAGDVGAILLVACRLFLNVIPSC